MNDANSSSPVLGLIVWAVVWLFFTFCSYNVGKKKGRGGLGFVLGCFLGLLGLIIISCMSRSRSQPRVTSVRSAQPHVVIPQQRRAVQPPLVIPQPPLALQPPLVIPQPPLALQRNDAWWPDPFGRHEHRYHDGSQWTDHVSDQGVTSVSPAIPVPAPQ